jgi:hypothetical protein
MARRSGEPPVFSGEQARSLLPNRERLIPEQPMRLGGDQVAAGGHLGHLCQRWRDLTKDQENEMKIIVTANPVDDDAPPARITAVALDGASTPVAPGATVHIP